MSPALSVLAVVVLVVGWRTRPAHRRVPDGTGGPSASRQVARRSDGTSAALPRWVRPLAAVGAAAVALVSLGVMPTAVCLGTAWGVRRFRQGRARARRHGALDRELPEVIDLLHLGALAGLTVPLVVEAVGRHGRGSMCAALAHAARAAQAGAPLADELEALVVELGPSTRPVVTALVDSSRYGSALGPSLERLSVEARASARRRAEVAARSLPVRLLFPLTVCVLPAFMLLTVVPLLADGLASLDLPAFPSSAITPMWSHP